MVEHTTNAGPGSMERRWHSTHEGSLSLVLLVIFILPVT